MAASSSSEWIKAQLSENKQDYINNFRPDMSHKLSVERVGRLRDYYSSSYGITIIINGETEKGKQLQQAHQATCYEKIISPFLTKSTKFPLAAYVQKFYLDSGSDNGWNYLHYVAPEHSWFYDSYAHSDFPKVKAIVAPTGFVSGGSVRADLSLEELENLNTLLSALPQTVQDQIRIKAEEYIDRLKHNNAQRCITHDMALDEVKHIQDKLGDDEVVGYLYTNGIASGEKHFEVLIITKSTIIKPIVWDYCDESLQAEYFFSPQYIIRPLMICPQADQVNCATLGMVTLKQLLKESAKQLKENTMIFKFPDENGTLNYLFLPSPQTLKYSQSSTYNSTIKSIIESEEESIEIERKGGSKLHVITLFGALKRAQGSEMLTKEEREHCKTLLNNLPQFRKDWLGKFGESDKTRDCFLKLGRNNYLTYKNLRVFSRIKPVPVEEVTQETRGHNP